jgi:hypothetical protein
MLTKDAINRAFFTVAGLLLVGAIVGLGLVAQLIR